MLYVGRAVLNTDRAVFKLFAALDDLGFWRHPLQSVADLHGSVAAQAKVSPSQYFYGHLVTRESVLPCNFSQPLSGTRVRARNRLTALSMF